MSKTLLTALLATPLLSVAAPVGADVLILDEVRQVERMDVPANGQNKADVEARYGTPNVRHDAVGEPPITRWDYESYSVYFEYDLVLFTVLQDGEAVAES